VWAKSLGISWYVGVDGISLFLVLMAAVLFPIVLVSAKSNRDPRAFVGWMLLLEAACMGSFLSLDLILFFLFFELTLVPAYFIIGGWGYAGRAYAAIKFFVYTFFGSAFLLVGILVVAFLHQSRPGCSPSRCPPSSTPTSARRPASCCSWRSRRPSPSRRRCSVPHLVTRRLRRGADGRFDDSRRCAGQLGTYGIIRFDLNLFPQASRTLAPLLLTLAVIGILYGAVVACAQRDMKRLIAYSSLAQIGFIALGTFAFTTQGLTGGVLLMVNHGLITAALFLLVGWIYERRHTWQVNELRGLQRPPPSSPPSSPSRCWPRSAYRG